MAANPNKDNKQFAKLACQFVFHSLCRAPVEWNGERDVLMLREMVVSDVFSFKEGSVSRGGARDSTAEKLIMKIQRSERRSRPVVLPLKI